MNDPRPDVFDAVHRLADGLESAGIDYAIGGAIALAYWASPRATADVDIGVDIDAMALPQLLTTLKDIGCAFDQGRALHRGAQGDFGVTLGGVRVDVYLPIHSAAVDALNRRIQVPFDGGKIWIVSCEDLIILKLLYGRTKDFADLERVVALQGDSLDRRALQDSLRTQFPAGDPRLQWLKERLREG